MSNTLIQGIVTLLALITGLFAAPHLTSPSLTLATSSVSIVASTTLPNLTDTYTVVKVVDGDTLVISIDGTDVTLRLIGLDTPETVDPRKPVQCFGREASDKAKELLTGTRITIETDPSQGTLDKYGRTLAYAYLPDGRLFNQYMIAEGYGHEYTYNLPYRYQKEFKAAEKQARAQKKGLWADSACANALAPEIAPATSASGTEYVCSRNAYDCADFKTQAEAQEAFELCGGSSNDIHNLDRDRDGRVCETLP